MLKRESARRIFIENRYDKLMFKITKMIGEKIKNKIRNRLNKNVEKTYNAKYWKNLDEMVGYVNLLSVHCPYTPETFHLLSKQRLRLLKRDCILIIKFFPRY